MGQEGHLTGMRGFTIVWVGQVASLLGTAISNFALTLWAYEVTGKATPLALVGFFFTTPMVVLSPVVGVMVDRGNRKLMMMLSDLAAALTTALVLTLYISDGLQIWHLYIAATISGAFQGFQWPAYSAAITMMLPKEHYGRANGMLELAGNGSYVFAPIVAGTLLGPLGLTGLLVIDLISAAIAIGALLVVHIPQPARSEPGPTVKGSFWEDAVHGFRYIFQQPSLLGLQTVFLVGNFFAGLAFAVFAPMILGRTGNDELVFGSVQSVGAIGGVVGGVAMSIWGGPKRRVHGVLLGWFCTSVFGQMVLGLGRSLPLWSVGLFLSGFFSPVINGSNQAIWQAKVPPDVQGRVFTTRRLIAWLVAPLSRLMAGPLVDQVLEPAMAEGSALTTTFGWLVGEGTGAGMGLLFVVAGLFAALTGLSGYLFPAVRDVERILPDHEVAAGTASHA
jgi:DHA3 family macrolide efflux protein-like MFS transporter